MGINSFSAVASHHRAMALGVVVTVAGAVASWLLLRWSVAGFTAATASGTVPVSEGFVVLIGGVAVLACAALSGLSALGVVALCATPHPQTDRSIAATRLAPGWGPRVAVVLLALSLSAPAAHATPPSATTTTYSAAVTQSAEASMAADHDSDATNPPAPALPEWSPTAPILPGADVRSDAQPTTSFVRPQPSSGVVVTRGDTLWDIAASTMGPRATKSEIAAAWPTWYEKNRHVIGPNPHLLLPGQILQPPSPPGAQP